MSFTLLRSLTRAQSATFLIQDSKIETVGQTQWSRKTPSSCPYIKHTLVLQPRQFALAKLAEESESSSKDNFSIKFVEYLESLG